MQVPIPATYLEVPPFYSGQEGEGDSPESVNSDFDKKSSESSFDSDDSPPSIGGDIPSGGGSLPPRIRPPKPSKQFPQSVVKSFGSISRSMSKRIKRNLSKLSRTGSFSRKKGGNNINFIQDMKKGGGGNVKVATHQNYILAAAIKVDQRQPYQAKMIENYVTAAKERFLRENSAVVEGGGDNYQPRMAEVVSQVMEQEKQQRKKEEQMQKNAEEDVVDKGHQQESLKGHQQESLKGHQQDSLKGHLQESPSKCINSDCNLYGTAETSYMCASCFQKQCEEEAKEYERQFSGGSDNSPASFVSGMSPVRDERDFAGDSETVPPFATSNYAGAQYGAGKSKFYASLDEYSVRNANLIPTTQSISSMKDKTLFLSNSTFYNDLPKKSYNLNKDLKREPSRSDVLAKNRGGGGSGNSESSSSIKSSPNLNDATPKNRQLRQDKNWLKTPIRDSLAPICIDEVRVQLATSNNASGVGSGGSGRGSGGGSGAFSSRQKGESGRSHSGGKKLESGFFDDGLLASKSCLTKGCEFYGNASTDSLCSKCHKRKTEAYSLDQVKLVQI